MGQVRHGSATTTLAAKAAIMRASPPLVRGMARMIASFARAAEPGARHQPQDGGEVAQARDGRGPQDRAEGTAVNCADRGGRSGGCCVPSPDALAAGRLSLRPAAIYPAPDPVGVAPVPAASRHLASSGRHRETNPGGRCSSATPSGSFTSTSPKCRWPRASSFSSSVSTALPSSPSLNSLPPLTERRLGSSCSTCSKPCPTRSSRFLPTTS